jgi:hypothetical protein
VAVILRSQNLMKNFEQIFDLKTEIYIDIIEKVIAEVGSVNYDYLYIEEYSAQLRKDPSEGSKIYWTEIINNAHAASLMSMYRHKLWISGIVEAYNNNNYLIFSASIRGLLESVSDSNYSLRRVPHFLEQFSGEIEKAIKKLNEFHSASMEDFKFTICSDLEEDLLHFIYARRLSRKNSDPNYHNAQTNTNYINTLDNTKFLDLYSDLCQITHPAMPSVMDYFDVTESTIGYNNKIDFVVDKNLDLIKKLISRYKKELNTMLCIGFGCPIAILKEVNKLNYKPLYIKTIDDIAY